MQWRVSDPASLASWTSLRRFQLFDHPPPTENCIREFRRRWDRAAYPERHSSTSEGREDGAWTGVARTRDCRVRTTAGGVARTGRCRPSACCQIIGRGEGQESKVISTAASIRSKTFSRRLALGAKGNDDTDALFVYGLGANGRRLTRALEVIHKETDTPTMAPAASAMYANSGGTEPAFRREFRRPAGS